MTSWKKFFHIRFFQFVYVCVCVCLSVCIYTHTHICLIYVGKLEASLLSSSSLLYSEFKTHRVPNIDFWGSMFFLKQIITVVIPYSYKSKGSRTRCQLIGFNANLQRVIPIHIKRHNHFA